MTITSAINAITVAQGGTADSSGTIAGAIDALTDALTDALAGSDIPEGRTIEDNVKILGEHLSGGGGGSVEFAVAVSDGDSWLTSDYGTIAANGETLTHKTVETVNSINYMIFEAPEGALISCTPPTGYYIDEDTGPGFSIAASKQDYLDDGDTMCVYFWADAPAFAFNVGACFVVATYTIMQS